MPGSDELYPPFQKPEIPVKVVGTIKEFTTDSTDPEDWTFPSRYKIKRELLRSMAPNALFAHCAMLQAVEDARLTEADISNPQTGLYAASEAPRRTGSGAPANRRCQPSTRPTAAITGNRTRCTGRGIASISNSLLYRRDRYAASKSPGRCPPLRRIDA